MCIEKSKFKAAGVRVAMTAQDVGSRVIYSMPESEKALRGKLAALDCQQKRAWFNSNAPADELAQAQADAANPSGGDVLYCDPQAIISGEPQVLSYYLPPPSGPVEGGASGEFGFVLWHSDSATGPINPAAVVMLVLVQWEIPPDSDQINYVGTRIDRRMATLPDGGFLRVDGIRGLANAAMLVEFPTLAIDKFPGGIFPCMYPGCVAQASPGGYFVDDGTNPNDLDSGTQLVNNARNPLANSSLPLNILQFQRKLNGA